MWAHRKNCSGHSVFIWVDRMENYPIGRMEQYLEQGYEVIKWIKQHTTTELWRRKSELDDHFYSDAEEYIKLHFLPHEYTISVVLRDKRLEVLFKLTFV